MHNMCIFATFPEPLFIVEMTPSAIIDICSQSRHSNSVYFLRRLFILQKLIVELWQWHCCVIESI